MINWISSQSLHKMFSSVSCMCLQCGVPSLSSSFTDIEILKTSSWGTKYTLVKSGTNCKTKQKSVKIWPVLTNSPPSPGQCGKLHTFFESFPRGQTNNTMERVNSLTWSCDWSAASHWSLPSSPMKSNSEKFFLKNCLLSHSFPVVSCLIATSSSPVRL